MAKKNKLGGREFRLSMGVVLLIIGIVNAISFWNLLLIIFGGYLIWDGVRKRS